MLVFMDLSKGSNEYAEVIKVLFIKIFCAKAMKLFMFL